MRSLISTRVIKTLAFVGLAAIGAADVSAGLTSFNSSRHASEMSHAQILSSAYGGTFASSGDDFSNGAITASRIGDGADQLWSGDSNFSARALARFAGSQQQFGLVDGNSGGSFEKLFDVAGWGTNVTGSANNLDLSGQNFRMARAGVGDATFTSSDADNILGADQMITYRLTGPNGLSKYVLFFEDVGAHLDGDWDFNDMVVEITSGGAPHAVPLPPAAWSGLAILLSGGLLKGRARMRALLK